MKHRFIIFFLLIVFLLTNLFPAYAAGSDSPPVKGAYPQTVAKAAVLMDASSGRVLYAVNARQHMAPASVTKIMTGLI
ncbi:MAG: D-alanyl-D-alanine carboxypeptidase, partial [Syntrophomonas sp.]